MFKNLLLLAGIFSVLFLFPACDDDDDPEVPNEEELITTVNYTLTPAGGGTTVILSFVDLDGDGSGAPIITGGSLLPNQVYTGSLELLNETESPAEDITAEILDEDEEHQFFFQSNIAGLTVAYADEDSNGNPVGLSSTLTTGDEASGTLTITLKHEPVKDATGVSDGDITNAGGETDIAVTIPIDVE